MTTMSGLYGYFQEGTGLAASAVPPKYQNSRFLSHFKPVNDWIGTHNRIRIFQELRQAGERDLATAKSWVSTKQLYVRNVRLVPTVGNASLVPLGTSAGSAEATAIKNPAKILTWAAS
jgi:hypothetical protein